MINTFGCTLLVIALNVTLGGLATQYVVFHWLHHALSFLPAALIGLIGGQVIIPAALITWILIASGVLR